MFATMALGCANDPDSGVRAAAIRTLGFAVTFNTLSDVGFFLLYILETRVLIVFFIVRMHHSFWTAQRLSCLY
jgi:hypothetical protein